MFIFVFTVTIEDSSPLVKDKVVAAPPKPVRVGDADELERPSGKYKAVGWRLLWASGVCECVCDPKEKFHNFELLHSGGPFYKVVAAQHQVHSPCLRVVTYVFTLCFHGKCARCSLRQLCKTEPQVHVKL